MSVALSAGYYDSPRRCSTAELADKLDVSAAAASVSCAELKNSSSVRRSAPTSSGTHSHNDILLGVNAGVAISRRLWLLVGI